MSRGPEARLAVRKMMSAVGAALVFDVRRVNQNVVVVERPGECRASGARLQRDIYPAQPVRDWAYI